MNRMTTKTVTIFGSSKPQQGESSYQSAYELGLALGRAGFTICNGGYGGTMEASARGAKQAGSHTVGITCTVFSRSGPNPYNDTVIETKDLFTRLEKLIELGDAYIALPGGSGTLVELAMVWEMTAKRLIQPRPIIIYGDYWLPVIEATARERPKSARAIQIADTIEKVLTILNTN